LRGMRLSRVFNDEQTTRLPDVIYTAVKSNLRGHGDRKKQGTLGRIV